MIRIALRVVTTAAATAAVVTMTGGCSAGATTPQTAASWIPSAPQRAVRIYPVGSLIVDVTSRDREPSDARGLVTRLAQRGERLQEAR
jgi:hypothetical protein